MNVAPLWTAPNLILSGGGGQIRAPAEIFDSVFTIFLVLGTAVFVVVLTYMVYNAYAYRHGSDRKRGGVDRPAVGELPTGSGGGRKLALSFSLSAIIVVSLIAWTYGLLLQVEEAPKAQPEGGDPLVVKVVGYQFGWEFVYPNGHTTRGTLRVPADRVVTLRVTSRDVFHTFGIAGAGVKTDAIPGQLTETWFYPQQPATYTAQCYELCGTGHSFMEAEIVVMQPDAYRDWYAATNATASNATSQPSDQSNATAVRAPGAGVVA